MRNAVKIFILLFFFTAGCNTADAKMFQPHIYLPAPVLYEDDFYEGPDTVPAKVFVKAHIIQPALVKQPQVLQPAKNLQVAPAQNVKPVKPGVTVTQPKKDVVLIRKMLYEGFKPTTKSTAADTIKIKHIIDSVVSKTDDASSSAGNTMPSYQDLVRIIDSLLKANKIDSTKVIVDTPIVPKKDSAIVNIEEKKQGSDGFMQTYWWLIALVVLLLAGIGFFMWKKKKSSKTDPKIFFSYAWDQDEAFIMQLYNSLKKEGFNVIKDKENIGYKGVISKFMEEIGSADFVIVAISDKYLKSRFCMYELYEIFRNSGMNSDRFGKKIFPVRIDESLNLSDPDVVNGYARYWKEQEQEWTKRVKDESDSITEEQARQFQFIKRLVNDVNNILSCLADINSLNLTTLRSNDFADVKTALRSSM